MKNKPVTGKSIRRCDNDAEMISEFISVLKTPTGKIIKVREIVWSGPHTPGSHWTQVGTMPSGSSQCDVDNELFKVLRNRTYFLICTECNERNPAGWMLDGKICQRCGERNHGVVH